MNSVKDNLDNLLISADNQGKLIYYDSNKYLPLSYLKDIDIYPWPRNGQILVYDETQKKWTNKDPPFIYREPSGIDNSIQTVNKPTNSIFDNNKLHCNSIKINDISVENGIISNAESIQGSKVFHLCDINIDPLQSTSFYIGFDVIAWLANFNGIPNGIPNITSSDKSLHISNLSRKHTLTGDFEVAYIKI